MKELVPNDDPVQGLGDFFDLLWGPQDGYVYLPNKDPKAPPTENWQKVMFAWPTERAKVIQYALATTAKGHDVYCAPAVFKEKSPKRENVKGSYLLWVDFDGNAPGSWADTTPTDAQEPGQEALNRLGGTAPTPTLRINSSRPGHEHVYWRLDKFETDLQFIEDTNRALAYKYEADTSGWDLNQVLRPPYTTNYKHDLPVTIEAATEREYDQSYFAGFKKVKQVVSDSISIGDLPQVEKVIALYKWDTHHFDLFFKPEIEEGKRSSALMALGYFGAERGMSNEEIYALLINADSRWGKFKNRSDRERRLLDIINKARQKHPVGTDSDEGVLRGLLSSADDVEESPQLVFGFKEFNNLEVNIEWIIEGLLERKGIGLVASPPGVGKTQLSLQFATCCALGTDFFVWPISRPLKILWFSLEMYAPALQYFTKQMGREFNDAEHELLDRNLKIIPLGEVLPLDTPDGKKFFESLLEEYQPDGIVLDSLGKITHAALGEEKAKELNSYYAKIRSKYDVFLWFIHHNRKANGDNKKPKELSDIYGSQYLTTDLTVAFSMWKDSDADYIELNQIKTRLGEQHQPLKLRRNKNLLFDAEQVVANSILDSPLVKEVKGDNNDGELPGSVHAFDF